MASDVGTVSIIKPPKLRTVLLPDLIKFETAYAQYVREVEDVNATRSEDNQLRITSIRSCIESRVLQSLCMLGEIEGASTIEEANDENVKAWFDTALAETPRTVLARLKSAVATLKYEQCDEDPAGAAQQFCLSAVAALDEQNISAILQDVEKCKTFIDSLINKVEPPFLRRQIKEERTIWSKEQQGSMQYFMRQLKSNAVEAHKWASSRHPQPVSHRPDRKRFRTRDDNTGEPSKKAKAYKPSKAGHKEKDRRAKRDSDWADACLNPDCNAIHRVKDCPITSEEEKASLLKKYYDSKKSAKSVKLSGQEQDSSNDTPGVAAHPDSQIPEPNAEEGRFRVVLEDKIESIALSDTGSDFNAIPSSIMEKVVKIDLRNRYQRFRSSHGAKGCI